MSSNSAATARRRSKLAALRREARSLEGVVEAPKRAIALAQPTLVKDVPTGVGVCHESKFDGYRLTCVISEGVTRCLSRQGVRWNARIPSIVTLLESLQLADSQLDGELIAVDAEQRDNFELLQRSLDGSARAPLAYVAFDLMRFEGLDLTRVPLLARKLLLQKIVEGSSIIYSTHIIGNGAAAFEAVTENGYEGLVSKRIDEGYPSGRTRSWVKTMARRHEDFAVVGFMSARGASGAGYMLARLVDGRLAYAGRVNTGLDRREIALVRAALERTTTPAVEITPYLAARASRIRWFRPTLVFRVAYRAITTDGQLRHPSIVEVQPVR